MVFIPKQTEVTPVSQSMDDGSNGGRAYELTCTDCAFTTQVQGDVDEIYDVIEGHRERMENSPAEHFVDFQAVTP